MGSEGGVLWRLADDWRAEEGPPPLAFWLFVGPPLLVPVPLLLLPDEKYKRKMRQCPGLGSPSPRDGEMKAAPIRGFGSANLMLGT